MRSTPFTLAIFVLLFQYASLAQNNPVRTADDLMEECKAVEFDAKHLTVQEAVNMTACLTYISGVIDGYGVGVATSGGDRTMLCEMPDAVTPKQAALIVLHYIRDNPADLH